ncbi:MAG: sigma-70 family RNA polymerase sigma factor [Gammaproteobacteria bacterium]|nr:sigma-70 family RNA polymerase sigma factor [Gammaproteobacteria bacterium]
MPPQSDASCHGTQVLYREHHGWLLSWLRRRLGCGETAADLAHDTFLKVLAKKRRGEAPVVREPRAYLRVIAGGLLVDHFRRRDLEQVYLEALAAQPEPTAISPEERKAILEALHRIDAMLDRMPPAVRRAFLLSQLEGLSYAQIAVQLDVSVRTVKRYMQQAFIRCLALMV